jgi:uncharacterized protein (TIGR00725 family)
MAIISVFGSNGNLEDEVLQIAEEIGELIVNMGHRVCCGGRGGVMEAVSKGARQSKKWTGNEVIGLMPESDNSMANEYLDIILPTGLGLFRNTLVAQCADACISISGGAGTLSEIAFAWQIGKPIAAMVNSGGWSEKLAGTHIDHRFPDRPVAKLENLRDAKEWLDIVLN